MIEQGLVLMGAGMGVVGLFLTLMVIVMYGASAILRKFEKEPPKKKTIGGGRGGEDVEIAVAIAAVKAHTRG